MTSQWPVAHLTAARTRNRNRESNVTAKGNPTWVQESSTTTRVPHEREHFGDQHRNRHSNAIQDQRGDVTAAGWRRRVFPHKVRNVDIRNGIRFSYVNEDLWSFGGYFGPLACGEQYSFSTRQRDSETYESVGPQRTLASMPHSALSDGFCGCWHTSLVSG